MAEGDSIHRLARRFEGALVGASVSANSPGPRRPDGRAVSSLDGQTLLGAQSRGKHLLLRFSEGLVLHSHLGMKGSWHLYRRGERWRRPARLAWIVLSDGETEAVNFNGTSMRIVREAELARDPRLARLGPDILAEDNSVPTLAGSLRRAGAAKLGDALLDQALIAGIGNIFKSEGCWAARIDPWRPVGDLSADELERTVAATRELMLEASDSGRKLKRVYGRSRMPCPRCRTPIRSRRQGDQARLTYWCPRCQG